jgi:predicted nucleotidyltransferase
MKTEEKILRYFIENKEEEISIRELSKRIKSDYKIVHVASSRLVESGLIEKSVRGNVNLLKYFGAFSSKVFKIELDRREKLIKKKDFRVFYEYIHELEFPLICLVFGSFVKENFSKNSDIDVLIITKNKKQVEDKLNLLPMKLDLNIFSYSEFLQMLRSRSFSVVSEAVKKNIVLEGIEEYYRLLEVSKNDQ